MAGLRPRYTQAQVAEQARKCTEMRVAGTPVAEIARQVGIAEETVATRIDTWFATHPPANAAAMRNIVLARYDQMYCSLHQLAAAGNAEAIRPALDILAAVRKLCGLDAPTRIDADVNHHVAPEDIELVHMISALEGRNRALIQGQNIAEDADAQ